MSTRNELFFAELNSPTAAKWSAGVAFDRSNALPLDQWSVFQTKAEAESYLEGAKAYPGQVIAYADTTKNGEMVVCVLSQNGEGDALILKPVGIIPTGEGAIEVDENGKITFVGFDGAQVGTIPVKTANGIVWQQGGEPLAEKLGDKINLLHYGVNDFNYEVVLPSDSGSTSSEGYILINNIIEGSNRTVLKDINIPDYIYAESLGMYLPVQEIASHAFEGMNIETVTFPSTLWTIGVDAFKGCEDLHTVKFMGSISPSEAQDAFTDCNIQNAYFQSNASGAGGWNGVFPSASFYFDYSEDFVDIYHDIQDKFVEVTSREDQAGDDHTAFKHYIIKQGGAEIGHIDIPRDLVVKSGKVETVTVADQPYPGAAVGDKYIDIEINNQTEHLYIPAKDLVEYITVDNTGKAVELALSDDHVLTADVKLSNTKKNILLKQDNGLYVGLTGENSITVDPVTGENGLHAVSLKLAEGDKAGNVALTQSTDGLKANVEFPDLDVAEAVNGTAPITDTTKVIASIEEDNYTITPTVVEVVTKKAWDEINTVTRTVAIEGEEAIRLITNEEIAKLEKFNISDGDLTIQGTVDASSVKKLYEAVENIVTGTGEADLDNDVEGTQKPFGIEKGAQVNKIESIKLPGGVFAEITENTTIVSIPAATNAAYGVVKGSQTVNKITYDENGIGEVYSLSTAKLVDDATTTLIINAGEIVV